MSIEALPHWVDVGVESGVLQILACTGAVWGSVVSGESSERRIFPSNDCGNCAIFGGMVQEK